MLRVKFFVLFMLASLFGGTYALADTPPSLSANIEILEVNENDQISISLKFTLKNESDSNIEILKWGTPFEGEFTSDCFDVRYDGEQVLYQGMLVKRGAPQPTDFIKIGANEEISGVVKLEDGYQIYKEGVYTVRYREDAIKVKASPANQTGDAQVESFITKLSPTRSNQVEFVLLQGRNEPAAVSRSPSAKNYQCSAAEMSEINSGYTAARSIASTARSALNNAPVNQRPQAQRYIEWFGVYNPSRYSTVAGQFNRIHDVLMNQTIVAVCSDLNAYAFVYPSEPYRIYFARGFFSAPLYGTDSKAGVFVHEMSHFYVVAGTKDHVYGQNNARQLARTDPNRAIKNADNNEYFAENTPALPMPTGSPPDSGDDDDDGDSSGCFIQSIGK